MYGSFMIILFDHQFGKSKAPTVDEVDKFVRLYTNMFNWWKAELLLKWMDLDIEYITVLGLLKHFKAKLYLQRYIWFKICLYICSEKSECILRPPSLSSVNVYYFVTILLLLILARNIDFTWKSGQFEADDRFFAKRLKRSSYL